MDRERVRVICYSVLLAVIFLGIWQASVAGNKPGKGVPGPAAVARTAVEMLSNPFYNNGPNDKARHENVSGPRRPR
jgi:ABC-type nitrate/sulfonate/bicarbonate transport system permease component